ncbi:hypothetical protein M430DRAFT_39966 [Amorphotheca resinae ATCC 22711]|uniref:Uncharacterized protein n=1 Tax=Amorphotheca resinae ATCC 22711 TaxID=857342 RepID=A0A2T3BCC9_AMORE|nr:hypothetical protein M430DRAFT_39966 [Amorphotheca resinae ATCC 22711]PSS25950.1 hypothetical protein M430DRAFT_39966 [Amorphotheca resinae ATCC 22711]
MAEINEPRPAHDTEHGGKSAVEHSAEIPTPPASHNDYSDAASVDSQNQRPLYRRHPRGGRKQKKKKGGRLKSVSELELLRGPGQAQEEADEEDEEAEPDSRDENTANGKTYDGEDSKKPKASRPRSPRTAPRRGTGVRAFNMQRAESSSRGGPPIGIKVERPNAKGKRKQKRGQEPEEKKQEGAQSGGEEGEGEEDEDMRNRKPVSIRLDLNLELEVFLKAKIKGDVTITFLE